MTFWVIARLTFREAARSRILLAALLLGLAFLLIYGLGFNFVFREFQESVSGPSVLQVNEISSFLTLSGLYAVNFLSVMMTVLTSVATLSSEISSGTMHTLASKPIHRWEILLGKWVGYALMLSAYLGVMAGGVLLIVYLISGYTVPNPARGVSFMYLNALLLLSLSLCGGAALSTLANGVLVFGMFGIAFIGGWIEQFGGLLENQTAINIGILSSLILPSEALWKRALFEMQSPLVAALGFTPLSAVTVPSPLFIGYAVLYSLVAVFIGIRIFQRRDL
jgi:ABC-type transport system involved in multi-copper enzyme maturation permease subunit